MYVITGATGLVGSHLLLDLCRQGHRVRALKRSASSRDSLNRLFGQEAHLLDLIDWIDADVLDVHSLMDALKGASHVYHCAAFVSFVPAEVRQMLRVNIDGTANVVNACLESGIEKLCHVSSVAAINRINEEETIHEDMPWKVSKENSSYAIAKYGSEREVWRGVAEGLPAVVVNPSLIIGPGDWHRSSDAIFSKIWNGLRYYTEGITGWVDVRDVVRSMTHLMDSGITSQRYIVSAENLPFKTVFDWAAECLNKPRPSVYAGKAMRNVAWRTEAIRCKISNQRPLITRETALAAGKKVRFSNSKLKSTIGIEFIPIRDAVERTCAVFLGEKELRQ